MVEKFMFYDIVYELGMGGYLKVDLCYFFLSTQASMFLTGWGHM